MLFFCIIHIVFPELLENSAKVWILLFPLQQNQLFSNCTFQKPFWNSLISCLFLVYLFVCFALVSESHAFSRTKPIIEHLGEG